MFPFASRGLTAVIRAIREDKPFPALEECKPPLLLLPNDSKEWEAVQSTFSMCKLPQDCAQKQFREQLPLIPLGMLAHEYDTHVALSSTLSHQTLLETFMGNNPESDECKVLAKTHLVNLMRALYAFFSARKACREHVFKYAKVRHEPLRLINSSMWGKDLFPDTLVTEILEKAAQEKISLITKWDAGYPTNQGRGKEKRNNQGQGKEKRNNQGQGKEKKKSHP